MISPELPSWIEAESESNKQELPEFSQKPVGAWDLTAAGVFGRWSQEAAEGGDRGRESRQGRNQSRAINEQITSWVTRLFLERPCQGDMSFNPAHR